MVLEVVVVVVVEVIEVEVVVVVVVEVIEVEVVVVVVEVIVVEVVLEVVIEVEVVGAGIISLNATNNNNKYFEPYPFFSAAHKTEKILAAHKTDNISSFKSKILVAHKNMGKYVTHHEDNKSIGGSLTTGKNLAGNNHAVANETIGQNVMHNKHNISPGGSLAHEETLAAHAINCTSKLKARGYAFE